MTSERLKSVRNRLKTAIEDYELVMREEDNDPEDEGVAQMVTHWVVVFSVTGAVSGQEEMVSRTGQIRSDDMPYWQAMGLLRDGAWFAQRDWMMSDDD